jgi:type IV pilus assembly protein PilE
MNRAHPPALPARCSRQPRGFTLIELMITVAVVAILAAVAYPSYLDHIRKSRRAEAKQALMGIASRQQQFLLDTRDYGTSLAAIGFSLPTSIASYYTVTLATAGTATVPAFTATAAPMGDQTRDTCGTLAMNNTGTRTPVNCW